jgi:nucleoside-diphosphate-sugar epimerase
VLVIGSRSFVGRRVAERLRAAHTVETAGRDAGADLQLELGGSAVFPPPGERSYDAIVHCAASFEPSTPGGMLRNELVNAVGALEVGELATRTGCRRLVLLSTVSVFDEHEGRCTTPTRSQAARPEPRSPVRTAGIALCTLCPGGVYDERGEGRRHQPLLYHIVDCARRGQDFELHGKADPLRNFLHVDDLASVVEATLRFGFTGTFPALHPHFHRVQEIAELAFRVFGAAAGSRRTSRTSGGFASPATIFTRIGRPAHRPIVGSLMRTSWLRRRGATSCTGVGAIIGYGVVNSLRLGRYALKIVGLDIYAHAVGQYWCDAFERSVPVADPGYTSFLQDVIARHRIDLVIPGIEQDVTFLSRHRAALADTGARLALNDAELIALSDDKWLTREALAGSVCLPSTASSAGASTRSPHAWERRS